MLQRHVDQASDHRDHRLFGGRHDIGQEDVRADLSAREDQRGLHRRRRLPPLGSRRNARADEGGSGERRPPLQPLRRSGQPVPRARKDVSRLFRDRRLPRPYLRPRRGRGRDSSSPAGNVHAVARLRARLRPALLRRPARSGRDGHDQPRPICRSQDRRRAGHQSRMDSEAASRQGVARLHDRSGHRHDPAPHARLHQLHLSAIHAHGHQLPARADRRHIQSVHRALDPDTRRIDGRHPLPRSAWHRFSVPPLDDPLELHEPRQLDRDPRGKARHRDAAHPDADDSQTGGARPARSSNPEVLEPESCEGGPRSC